MFARPRDNRISPRPPEVEAISRRPIGPLLRVASPHVLLAEDDEANRWLLAQALMQAGFQVASCRDGLELLDKLAKSLGPGGLCLYDLIVSDIRMPKLTGLEALSRLPHNDGFPPMILITALTATFFLGGWLSPFAGIDALEGSLLAAPSFGWLILKMLIFMFLFLWFRATFPRYRYDQIMRLGWKVFIPITIVWIAVEGVMAAMQVGPWAAGG